MVDISKLACSPAATAINQLKKHHEKHLLLKLVRETPELLRDNKEATEFICQLIEDYKPLQQKRKPGRPKANQIDVMQRHLIRCLISYYSGMGVPKRAHGESTSSQTIDELLSEALHKSASTIQKIDSEINDNEQSTYHQLMLLAFKALGLLDAGIVHRDQISADFWEDSFNEPIVSFIFQSEVAIFDPTSVKISRQEFLSKVIEIFPKHLQDILKRGVTLFANKLFVCEVCFVARLINEELWREAQYVFGGK